MAKEVGPCHICGNVGDLSFEHVPPRRAFNDKRVMILDFETAVSLGPNEIAKGPIQQKGMGDYTLCPRCNNLTGHWYGKRFIDWCYQGMNILAMTGGNPTLFYMNYLFPLPVIKQIITMFFSINSPEFASVNQELVSFVLNRDKKYLSPKYRFFVYYNIEGRSRKMGVSALWRGSTRKIHTVAEISYPPFGYLMAIGSDPPDDRLFEISHFSRYDYNQFTVMELQLPVLPTHLMYPGDYRTEQEIHDQSRKSGA